MAGILFIRTRDLTRLRPFYEDTMEMEPWLEQDGIAIMAHENLLLGLHEADAVDTDGLVTFWYETRNEVDEMYERLRPTALSPPKVNTTYRIYNFFATDPDGRKIECQAFLHPTRPVSGVPARDGA